MVSMCDNGVLPCTARSQAIAKTLAETNYLHTQRLYGKGCRDIQDTRKKKTTLGIFIADEKEFRGIWMEHT